MVQPGRVSRRRVPHQLGGAGRSPEVEGKLHAALIRTSQVTACAAAPLKFSCGRDGIIDPHPFHLSGGNQPVECGMALRGHVASKRLQRGGVAQRRRNQPAIVRRQIAIPVQCQVARSQPPN